MARITGIDNIKEVVDKYASANADYFGLKNDGEQARIRFNHKDDKDLDIYVVHKVNLAGKDRYVECLSSEGKPCPFCQAGLRPQIRIFATLIDGRDGKSKIWDRGKTEIQNIVAMAVRYGDLSSLEFDIQRNGKPNDTGTTYQFFPITAKPGEVLPPLPPLPEREPIAGPDKFVLTKTEDEMRELLNQISPAGGAQQGTYSQQNSGQRAGKMF
jgi:hypothetical protein